jgi:hypothetical protein
MIHIRELTEADYPVIDELVRKRLWERSKKKWSATIDPSKVAAVMKNQNPNIHSVVVEETYILVFSMAHPWFSDKFFVEEKLVIKAFNGLGNFDDVTKALEHIARVSGAYGILTGTAMAPNDDALVRMYLKAGFEQSQVGLFKAIPRAGDIMLIVCESPSI